MQRITLNYPLESLNRDLPNLRYKHVWRRYRDSLSWHLSKDRDCAHHVNGLDQLALIHPDEVVVVTRQHNGARYLRSFLRHYRSMGADRIVVIDDFSTDGGPEFLAAQEDVIFLPAASRYAEANRGRDWFDAVLMRLPKGQRMVVVDIDEYLVFSNGTHGLGHLFHTMKRQKIERLCGIMLDFYPATRIKDAVFSGETDQLPWDVAPCFDRTGYTLRNHWRGPVVTGGVRHRLFGEELFLSKYPVLFNTGRAIYGSGTIHQAQPLIKNTLPIGAALLHFKYFSDFVQEHKEIIARGSHYQGCRSYRAVLERLGPDEDAAEFNFRGDCTVQYTGPKQLCNLGLIQDICA